MRIQINGNVYTEWHMVYALSRNACLNGEKKCDWIFTKICIDFFQWFIDCHRFIGIMNRISVAQCEEAQAFKCQKGCMGFERGRHWNNWLWIGNFVGEK